MDYAELLFNTYQPSDTAVGCRQPTGDVNEQGKVKDKMWTHRRPATIEDFTKHIQGDIGVGLPPINSESTCVWGAIDIDNEVYGRDLASLVRSFYSVYPHLVICRTKSGGLHLCLFFGDPVPAKSLIPELEKIASNLGFAGTEIFPKQRKIQTRDGDLDCGNWINLPYFGGDNATNYGFDLEGNALPTIKEYCEFVEQQRTDIKTVSEYVPPEFDSGDFSDGPPCLASIWANGVDSNRNISLTGAAVYSQKKYGEDWAKQVKEFNDRMAVPLDEREVQAIIDSYSKKEYFYSCSKAPMSQYCNKPECFQRKFGIGEKVNPFVGNRSLTKIASDPPRWAVDVETPQGEWERITCSTEELQSSKLYQKRCMEVINTVPEILKQADWTTALQDLFKDITVIPMAFEDTRKGQLVEMIHDYLENRPEDTPRSIQMKAPYYDGKNYMFNMAKLKEHLELRRFSFAQNELLAVLKTELGANSVSKKVQGKTYRVWMLPDTFELNESDELTPSNPENPFDDT